MEWLTISEALKELNISERTLRRWIKDKNIKAKKVGKTVKVFIEVAKEHDKKEDSATHDTKNAGHDIISILHQQLQAKDKQIEDLNERIRESHLLQNQLQSQLLLGVPASEQDGLKVSDDIQQGKEEKMPVRAFWGLRKGLLGMLFVLAVSLGIFVYVYMFGIKLI